MTNNEQPDLESAVIGPHSEVHPTVPGWCATFDAISDIVCVISREHEVLEINRAGCIALGLSRVEVVGRKCFRLVHGTSAPIARCPCVIAAQTGEPATSLLERDGGFFELSAWPVFDPAGVASSFVHVVKDITQSKRGEEERNLLRALIDQSADTIEVVDPETARILDVNERGCLDLGYSRDEYLALRVYDIDPMVDALGFAKVVQELRKRGSLRWEGTHRRKDGTTFPVEVNLQFARHARDCLVAVVRDVTARKLADGALQRSLAAQEAITAILRLSLKDCPIDELLRRALRIVLSTPPLCLERKGAILLIQEPGVLAMRAALGLPDALQRQCARVRFGECLCGAAASTGKIVRAARLDERHVHTYSGIEPHGHLCVPISYGNEVFGVLCTYLPDGHEAAHAEVDFVEAVANALAGVLARRSAEREKSRVADQLRQAQKLDALGRLAGGVAHDFNNLLTVIKSCACLAFDEVHEPDPVREDLMEILNATDRAAALTRQLLAFSRKQTIEPKALVLNDVIRSTVGMLRRLVPPNVAIELFLADDLAHVHADPGQMEQIIVNLVVNARDAMPRGGALTIETANIEVGEGRTPTRPEVAPGRYVVLSVGDAGCGMDEETMSHVFEPFFTTKEPGRGTGLGLSTVHGIVKQSGGEISVRSELGGGTTFRVILPRAEGDDDEAGVKIPSLKPGGGEAVLVVDVDNAVRKQVARILQTGGFDVLTASGGGEALLLWERHRSRIALLLTEVVMPLMSGSELAAKLKAEQPALRVLFMTGYAPESEHTMGPLEAGSARIDKPFSSSELRARVREVLDRVQSD